MSKRSFILYFDFLYYFERNGKQISPMAICHMVNVFFDFPFFLNLEFPSWHILYANYTRIPVFHCRTSTFFDFNFFQKV